MIWSHISKGYQGNHLSFTNPPTIAFITGNTIIIVNFDELTINLMYLHNKYILYHN